MLEMFVHGPTSRGPTQFCALPVLQNDCSIYCNQARNMATQSSTCGYAICNHLHTNEYSKSQKIPFWCVANAAKRDSNHKMSSRDIHWGLMMITIKKRLFLLMIVEVSASKVSMYWKVPSKLHCQNFSFDVIDVSGGVVLKFNEIWSVSL